MALCRRGTQPLDIQTLNPEKSRIGRNALGAESTGTRASNQSWQVLARWLVADLAVGSAAYEGEVRNVIGLAGGVTVGLEYGLREDVVKLNAVLRATVTQSNSKVGMPVACTSSVERQEHSLEKGTALISTFPLSGRDIEATRL
jgi:hypothetical protein